MILLFILYNIVQYYGFVLCSYNCIFHIKRDTLFKMEDAGVSSWFVLDVIIMLVTQVSLCGTSLRDSVTLLVCMCASSSAFSRSEMSSGCATHIDDSRHAKPCKERRYSRLCGGCMQGGEYVMKKK